MMLMRNHIESNDTNEESTNSRESSRAALRNSYAFYPTSIKIPIKSRTES